MSHAHAVRRRAVSHSSFVALGLGLALVMVSACVGPVPPPPVTVPKGTVTGVITADDTGLPLAGVSVVVTTQNPAAAGTAVTQTTTAADGTYSITLLAATELRHFFRFVGLSAGYGAEYYDNNSFQTTTAITLPSDGSSATVNAGLRPLGKIHGTVTDQGSFVGIGSVVVDLISPGTLQPVRTTTTAPDGSYRIDRIDNGPYVTADYVLRFTDQSGAGHPQEYFSNATSAAEGRRVPISPGTDALADESLGSTWPAGCTPAPFANLAGCNFTRADFAGVDLHGASLAGATMTDAKIANANLASVTGLTPAQALVLNPDWRGVDLHGSDLSLATQTLYGRNMAGADLRGLDLHGAKLYGGDLSNTDLRGAQLSAVQFMDFWPAQPGGWFFPGWPAACLSPMAMSGTRLAGATLDNVMMTRIQVAAIHPDWSGAHISFASTQNCTGTLQGGDYVYVDFTNFDFTAHHSVLVGTVLGGPMSFNYASFAQLDLTGFSCVGCQMVGTQLADTNLTNATFLGATGGAFGDRFAFHSNTTCPDGVIAGDVATPTCVGHGFN